MSYDIYGEPLQCGCCEVHPWVHEEWPCSLCISERNQREQNDRQNESEYHMNMDIELLKDQREELIKALESLIDITNDSQGVAGYHLNGDIAKWDEFEEVTNACVLINRLKGGE